MKEEKFSFHISPQALAAAVVQASEPDASTANAGRIWSLVQFAWVPPLLYMAALGALLLWMRVALIGPQIPDRALFVLPMFPAAIVIAYLASPSGYVRRWRRQAKRHAKNSVALWAGPVEVAIHQDGITYTDRWGTARYGWHAIVWCLPTADAMVLWLAQQRLIVIPHTAFGDMDIAAYAKQLIATIAKRGGEAAAVRSLLRDHDAKCPYCGFNMRGSPTPACTECGRNMPLHLAPVQITAYRP